MAKPKKPEASKKPKLIDDPSVGEIYADDFISFLMRGGNVYLTLATHRASFVNENAPPKMYRVVTARLVIPAPAMVDMYNGLGQAMSILEQQGAVHIDNGTPKTIQ